MNASAHPWQPPPEELVLSGNEVHVWRASLEQPPWQLRQLAQTLSPDEHRRANSFYFERDRRHFITSRGFLRILLSRYLGSEPRFLYGGGGKPELAATSGGSTFRFNASHSHGLALYAVTRERRVGIDVEALRPLPEAEAIAQLYFSSGENAVLRALPPERRQEAFFLGWTRKEAYLKAVGSGLVQQLECIEVSLAPGEPAILHSIDGDPEVAARWSLQTLPVDFGYVAALAVEGSGYRLACWQAPTPEPPKEQFLTMRELSYERKPAVTKVSIGEP